jgi:hypothetical protein
VLDMHALYSLVKNDGENLKALLEEQSHSPKDGYALSTQARMSLSFKCKIPEVFGSGKVNKMYHPFGDVATYIKLRFTENKQGFCASVEDEIRRVEASTTTKTSVQLGLRPEAHRLFLLMLTDSVNQMFKFHQMLDGQFLRYREVLGPSSDDENWLLCGSVGLEVLVGDYKARMIGADAFSDEVDHFRVAMFMWACLQTHRVMQSYIELEFISHPEIGAVVVEHLIKNRTPMSMHTALKTENAELKAHMKTISSNLDKLESRVGCQENDVKKMKEKK